MLCRCDLTRLRGAVQTYGHRNSVDLVYFLPNACVQNSVFGEGTYLTSDLSMAVLYSPHSSGWRESLLGPQLSCVAMCEVIDHPDVKCQVKKKGVCVNRVKILQHRFSNRFVSK